MDIRERLLNAAAAVFAETGYRGATTRRIATAAGVNEITLFRHFGSKDALINEALRRSPATDSVALPLEPLDPQRELSDWCLVMSTNLYEGRSVIRKVMGELEEHPEIGQHATACPGVAARDLSGYLERLRLQGRVNADLDTTSASAMLMGAIFAAAMGRDCMPAVFPQDHAAMITQFVRLFLRGIGADVSTPQVAAIHRNGS